MCKQEVGKDTAGDRLHACEVTRQLVRSCYSFNMREGDVDELHPFIKSNEIGLG